MTIDIEKNSETLHDGTDKTDKTRSVSFVSSLSAQNTKNFLDRTATALSQAEADQAALLAEALAEKSGLPHDHWKPLHVARMRFEAAKAVHEAIESMTQD